MVQLLGISTQNTKTTQYISLRSVRTDKQCVCVSKHVEMTTEDFPKNLAVNIWAFIVSQLLRNYCN